MRLVRWKFGSLKPSVQHPGTPLRRKVKHSQSARDCDCYRDAPDKNVERNYILSFLTKNLPEAQISGEVKEKSPSRWKSKKKKESKENDWNSCSDEKKRGSQSKKEKKHALKRATSITLERNRIIPLNDGSGKCFFLSQLTTIKENPPVKEEPKQPKKEENTKLRFGNFITRLSAIKRKARQYLLKRKEKKEKEKEITKEPIAKPSVVLEEVPSQDDFVEQSLKDEDEPFPEDPEETFPPDLDDKGRVSVCSSVYFTPTAGTPEGSRRRLPEEFEDADGWFVDSVGSPGQTAVDSIRGTLDAAGHTDHEELRRRLRAGEPLYPNNDETLWGRTCEHEILQPLRGTTSGMIPVWLKGTLIRNGPGSLKVGEMTFQHLFDGSALLHRFAINDGEVSYQCRFLRSHTYRRNQAANRIVVNEFGTKAVPDPCNSIFKRVSSLFDPGESLSDNAMISVYPFDDQLYCFTESPTVWRVDPTTLETLDRVNVSRHVGVVNHTSHPHVLNDGSVYNQAMSVRGCCPYYSIVHFPKPKEKSRDRKLQMFESAEVVASVKARWPLHPSYMHTFGLTDHYYVIVEQPLSISVPSLVKSQLFAQPICSCFRFFKDEPTLIHLVERSSGKVFRTYSAEAFFYLHIVNQYEQDGHVVIDICCYSDPAMLDCMYHEALKNMNRNPEYARLFRGRPMRFVLPLAPLAASIGNLVTLAGSSAAAYWHNAGTNMLVRPELLCDLGCEVPRFNYALLGRPYRYFYAISSDIDLDNPGTLIKVDTETRTCKTWSEPNVFPSEPVFVPSPDPQCEDDGVVLSALVWGRGQDKQVGLLVLDASSWHELGRTVFHTPSPVPKCLHGWFTPDL